MYLLAKFGVDTAEKQASQSLPRTSQMIEKTSKKVRKNVGRLRRGVRSPLDSRTERGPRGGRNVAAADPPPRPCPAGGLRRGERAAASARPSAAACANDKGGAVWDAFRENANRTDPVGTLSGPRIFF